MEIPYKQQFERCLRHMGGSYSVILEPVSEGQKLLGNSSRNKGLADTISLPPCPRVNTQATEGLATKLASTATPPLCTVLLPIHPSGWPASFQSVRAPPTEEPQCAKPTSTIAQMPHPHPWWYSHMGHFSPGATGPLPQRTGSHKAC